MKYVFSAILLALIWSCADFDEDNADLCTQVFCGEIEPDKVNFTVYNTTALDFEEFIVSVGGQVDTIFVLNNNQFTCWANLDSLYTNYIYASGISEGQVYESDTIVLSNDASLSAAYSGNFKLDVVRITNTRGLTFSLFEGFDGDCIELN